jgi:hypothetical protein
MWFELRQRCDLLREDEAQHVIPWKVNIRAAADDPAGFEDYSVGRILADELRPYELSEWGVSPWNVADADSGGLLSAYCALLGRNGRLREEFDAIGEPIVYVYRFALHDDFAQWRMAVLDCFCRRFLDSALILVQYHSTWFSLAEFEALGFRVLSPPEFEPPTEAAEINRTTRYMVRDNSCAIPFDLMSYPTKVPYATRKHAKWVRGECPLDGYC